MRLETDKRPRILLESGETLVSTVKRSTLEVPPCSPPSSSMPTPRVALRRRQCDTMDAHSVLLTQGLSHRSKRMWLREREISEQA
eukprot:810227-Rhodomonas_salina.3